ncbi:hypothetical protein SAMN05421803_14612 [Nocardiopsis flavescens]|uniref:Uncharacterized protein n=1 Tax=Nocardiopsis flavescens TaxID=758803 RepID=A0A1M6WLN1_9ACTN|nr:hypothetical protein SAMN05421803_14612 [Nocardiopsis flavescens]
MEGEPRSWWRDLRVAIITTALALLRFLLALGCFILWLVRCGVG